MNYHEGKNEGKSSSTSLNSPCFNLFLLPENSYFGTCPVTIEQPQSNKQANRLLAKVVFHSSKPSFDSCIEHMLISGMKYTS